MNNIILSIFPIVFPVITYLIGVHIGKRKQKLIFMKKVSENLEEWKHYTNTWLSEAPKYDPATMVEGDIVLDRSRLESLLIKSIDMIGEIYEDEWKY